MSKKPSNKGVSKLRGRPFDEFRCFYIKDFRKGDSVRVAVKNKDERFTKGVVTDVDLNNCLIHYRTAESDDNVTTIDRIISLEDFKKDFLDS